eukprot:5818200-Amphidinium_carterae.2
MSAPSIALLWAHYSGSLAIPVLTLRVAAVSSNQVSPKFHTYEVYTRVSTTSRVMSMSAWYFILCHCGIGC